MGQKFTWNSRKIQKSFLSFRLPTVPSNFGPVCRVCGPQVLLQCSSAKASPCPARLTFQTPWRVCQV